MLKKNSRACLATVIVDAMPPQSLSSVGLDSSMTNGRAYDFEMGQALVIVRSLLVCLEVVCPRGTAG